MIIINRRKIIFIECCILLSIVFSAISFSNTIETSSTPVSGHIVTLDAGHGKPDERS